MPDPVIAYTTSWCPDCNRSKRLMKSLGVEFHEVDIEKVSGAETEMRERNGGSGKVPTIIIGDGACLIEPSDADLSQAIADHYR